jgi:hypothetical protein
MEMRADSIREYSYPDGPAWAGEAVLTERKQS